MSNAVRLRQVDIWRLAAEANRDPGTVKRVLEGKGRNLSRSAVIEAARRLNIELPPGFEDPPPTRMRAT